MSISSIAGTPGQTQGMSGNIPDVTVPKRAQQTAAGTVTAGSPDQASAKISHQEVETAVKAVNEFVGKINDNLKFSVDHDTGKTIVKVVDSSTNEVIKQFPSEEMMAIAKAMDKLKGLLVQQKV